MKQVSDIGDVITILEYQIQEAEHKADWNLEYEWKESTNLPRDWNGQEKQQIYEKDKRTTPESVDSVDQWTPSHQRLL